MCAGLALTGWLGGWQAVPANVSVEYFRDICSTIRALFHVLFANNSPLCSTLWFANMQQQWTFDDGIFMRAARHLNTATDTAHTHTHTTRRARMGATLSPLNAVKCWLICVAMRFKWLRLAAITPDSIQMNGRRLSTSDRWPSVRYESQWIQISLNKMWSCWR